MNFRDMTLAVFRGEPTPHLLFQPRFEPWIVWHEQFGTLPEELRGLDIRAIYDRVGCSMRYVDYYTGMPRPIDVTFDEAVRVEAVERESGGRRYKDVTYHAPEGTLHQTEEWTIDRTWRTIDFPVKTREDLWTLLSMLPHRRLSFNADSFAQGEAYLGERGVPQFYLPKSPYFALAQQWMAYDDFIYTLADDPGLIEEVMEAIDEHYSPLYDELVAAAGTVRILNLGENIAEAYLSPHYFETYCLPWYARRMGQLREAGIFTHIHIDGYFKTLLPFLAGLPFDGLEALTPLPQGDVTIAQMAEATGEKVLLDGIPAVLFLGHHAESQLWDCIEELIDRFGPRLVLGISDELPQGADEEGYRRLCRVAEYCRTRSV